MLFHDADWLSDKFNRLRLRRISLLGLHQGGNSVKYSLFSHDSKYRLCGLVLAVKITCLMPSEYGKDVDDILKEAEHEDRKK